MIKFRQVQRNDYDFLYKLKKATLKEYIAQTWGWDEEWQREYHSQNFNPKLLKIIIKSRIDIGCISIIEENDKYFLSIIEILTKYQNQGIGTSLIKKLLSKAEKKNKTVYLQVLRTNEKAQKLYKNLGFTIDNETDTHYKMVYKKR